MALNMVKFMFKCLLESKNYKNISIKTIEKKTKRC